MRTAAAIVTTLSLLLVPTGGNLFVRCRVARVSRFLFRLLFLLVCITFGLKTLEAWQDHGVSLSSLSYTSYAGGFAACHLLLIVRRKGLESCVHKIIHKMSPVDQKRLLKQAVALVALVYTLYVNERVWFLISKPHVVRTKTAMELAQTIVYISASNWVMFTSVFYFLLFRLVSCYQKHLLSVAIKLIASGRLADVRLLTKEIRDTSRDFDRLLNPLPFAWFLYGILGSPSNLYYLRNGLSVQLLSTVIFAIEAFLVPVLVTLMISDIQSSLIQQVDEIQDQVMQDTRMKSSDILRLMRDLDSLKQLRVTGASCFTLDKSFVLSYVGSVVTFAALIATYANDH